MSISFTAMHNALLATGIYEITESTRLYAELKAYDAGLKYCMINWMNYCRKR